MNRVSIRTKYVGAEPACYGRQGWTRCPANGAGEAEEFRAEDGTRIPCNAQEVTVWLGGSGSANAA